MFVWNLDYSVAPWNDYCDQKGWFSVVNHDGSPRPAYMELARMAQEHAAPTPTASPAPGTGIVVGRILLQGRNDHHGAHVLVNGYGAATDEDGSFHVDGVPAGTHELCAQMSGYLQYSLPGLAVYEGRLATVPDVLLQAGDINGDDVVNLFDLVAVSISCGAQAPVGITEDVDGDGEVSLLDLVLVSANYGASYSAG
jgi:hypothetical protein